MKTYLEKCLEGDEDVEAIDTYVSAWHSRDEDGVSLHEYLGMTWEEYSLWVERPDVLPYIFRAHKVKQSVVDLINLESLPMAARAENAEEAQNLMLWLEKTGRLDSK